MRTQKEVERDSLQKHIKDAFTLAKYMGLDTCAKYLEDAFHESNR